MQKQRKTKYSIAETKQISSRNYTITPKTQNKFAKTERRYQIAEAEGKTKYQNNCRNCRNTKIIAETVEIPNFAEAEDKISLQKSWIREAVFGIMLRSIKPALIPC